MSDAIFAGAALLPFPYGGFVNKANTDLSGTWGKKSTNCVWSITACRVNHWGREYIPNTPVTPGAQCHYGFWSKPPSP